jgi:hypothetical protein
MQDAFQEIRNQIHEIRNIVGPVHLKFADLETRIVECRQMFEERTAKLESRWLATLFRLDKQDVKITDILAVQSQILDRLRRVENHQGGK